MNMLREFGDFPDAFDFVRECRCPMVVVVNGERWKLFPSGKAEPREAVIKDAEGNPLSGHARRNEAIRLRTVDGLPAAEIARLLGASVAVIGQDLRTRRAEPCSA